MIQRWISYVICLIGLPVFLWGLGGVPRVGALPPDLPAEALRYPVRLDDLAAGSPAHLRSLVERYTPGRVVHIESAGVTRAVIVAPAFSGAHRVISTVSALFFWMVACFVFAARPAQDPGRAFFFSTFCYGLAISAGTGTFPADPRGLDALRPVLRTVALALTPAFFVMMSFLFPRRRPSVDQRPWLLRAVFLTAVALATWRSFVLTDYFTAPTLPRFELAAFSEHLLDLFVAALVGVGCLVMYRSGRDAVLAREQKQLKWLWWGITVGTTPYVFLYALPRALGGEPVVALSATRVLALVVPVAMAVAAVKYKLLDIDVIIRRSLIYGVLATLLVAAYLVLAEAIGQRIAPVFPGSGRYIPLAGAVVSVMLYQPTRRIVGDWVDSTFFHIRRLHARALYRFKSAMMRPWTQRELAAFTRRFIGRILGARQAAVVVRVGPELFLAGDLDEGLARRALGFVEGLPGRQETLLAAPRSTSQPEIESDDFPAELAGAGIRLVQPLAAYGRVHGVLVLGEKRSEWRYVEEDVGLLSGVAAAASEALERINLAQRVAEERIGRERLDELNRMKSDFLSRVAHDLRTPVTSIDWSARNLLDGLAGPLDGGQKEYMQAIVTSAVHLGRLVTNLLEISRLEKPDGAYELGPVCLATVTDEAVECLMPIAAAREVRVERRLERNLQPVVGNREKLVQVVVNLVENALRYSPRGAAVEVSLERAAGTWQRLAVRDLGPGIAPGEEEAIFERFRQGTPSPHAQPQGFGLGLFVVRSHVEAFSGSVRAANRPGGGAEFTVLLPEWAAQAAGA